MYLSVPLSNSFIMAAFSSSSLSHTSSRVEFTKTFKYDRTICMSGLDVVELLSTTAGFGLEVIEFGVLVVVANDGLGLVVVDGKVVVSTVTTVGEVEAVVH